MKKTTYLWQMSQTEDTHIPGMVADVSFEELCEDDPDFQTAQALKEVYERPDVKKVYILLYSDFQNKFMRRKIAVSTAYESHEESLEKMRALAASVGISVHYHDKEAAKKLSFLDPEERAAWKKMLTGDYSCHD